MYCPNCGTELENPNQKFCQECGAQIPSTGSEPVKTSFATDMSQYSVPPATQPTTQPATQPAPQYTPTPAPQSTIKYNTNMEYSKKALGFGLSALLIAVVSLLVFPTFMFFPYGAGIIVMPVALGIHGLGLLFAILGTVYGSKANDMEPDNGMQKAGMAFAIIGIIFNALALLGLLGRAPSFLFNYYYYS
jgi:hypothetical protein